MTLETRPNTGAGLSWEGFGIRMHDQNTGEISFDFNSQSLENA